MNDAARYRYESWSLCQSHSTQSEKRRADSSCVGKSHCSFTLTLAHCDAPRVMFRNVQMEA